MKWIVAHSEGEEYEYVSLETLIGMAKQVAAFGAELGDKRVIYDCVLAARGKYPYRTHYRF